VSLPLSYTLTNSFHLPANHIKVCDKYYILYWQSRFVFASMLNGPRIEREGIGYEPILLDGLSQDYLMNYPDARVRCSFRRLRGKVGGYVLVQKIPSLNGVDTSFGDLT